jgi:hypothetical protein
MSTTFQTYNGNGSTTAFTFTFPYINTTDVKASIGGVATTAYTVSGSTLTFSSAPPAGTNNVKISRDTNNASIEANFQSGSALRAVDFNDNFTQLLYVTQESTDISDTATANAANSVTTSNAAVATANTASTNATNAVNTANTASSTATTALNTANAATTTANGAVTTANAATATANTASTNASAAVTTSNTANTTAGNAVTTANSAVSTANTANTTAGNAVTTANTAESNASSAVSTANAAQSAVANAVLYTPIANVASIPGSPSNNDYVEVQNSAGIGSFSPLANLPSGFTGAAGLTVRLRYTTSGSTWNFQNYFANDSEDRYFTKTAGNTNTTNIATKMPLAGGTFTGAVSFDDNVIVKGDGTNGSGELTLNCENNSHGIKIKGPPHSAAASYTLTLPNNTGTNGQFLSTNGSGVLSFGDVDLSSRLPLTGGTLTGALTLSGNPTAANHAANKAYVDTEVAGIVSSAPATLDTLNELAAALGDDPNFATTTANSIGTKLPLAGGTLTGGLTGTSAEFTGELRAGTRARFNTDGTRSNAQSVIDIYDQNGQGVSGPTISLSAGGSAEFAGSMTVTGTGQYTGAQRGGVSTLTSAATITINFNDSNHFTLTTGHAAILFANPTTEVAGQTGSIFIVQGSTTCAAPTWGNQWFFAGGTAPSLTGTTGKVARIDYIVQEAGKIHAVATDDLTYTS